MLKFQADQSHVLLQQLAERLVKSDLWELLPTQISVCMLRQKSTNKIFTLVQSSKLYLSGNQTNQCFQDQQLPQHNWDKNNDIFMQIIKVSEEYYLREKSVMSLASKICRYQICQSKNVFSEEEILNTFTPILESLTQNSIPSFYQITSSNIQIDSAQNIKFKNPLEVYYKKSKLNIDGLTLYEQMALVILETALMDTPENILNCMVSQEKITNGLAQKCYSYKLIGLVLILLNEGKQVLPIDLKQCFSSNFENPWFQMLKDDLEKKSVLLRQPRLETAKKTESKIIYRSSRRYNCKQYRFEDQTEDSLNQTLAKYRGGKRIQISRSSTIDSDNIENLKADLLDTQVKPKREKLKLNFNI